MNDLIADIAPVTPTQLGFLYLEQTQTETSLYHEQYIAELSGRIDIDRLKTAWQKTVDAHTILRTIFDWDGQNDPVQIVLRTYAAPFLCHVEIVSDGAYKQFLANDMQTAFELDTVPPHRLTLMRTASQTYRLIFTYHHILLDGPSVSGLFQYFAVQYNEPSEITSSNDYGRYARWIKSMENRSAQEAWYTYAQHHPYVPVAAAADQTQSATAEYAEEIDRLLTPALTEAAQKNQLTLNSVFQTVWSFTLAKSTGQTGVCVGSPVTVKPVDGSLDDVIGLCITTVPYMLSFDRNESLNELARRHQHEWGQLLEHSYLSLSDIKKAVGYRQYGDPFQTIITYSDMRVRTEPEFSGFTWQTIQHNEVTQYGLSIDVLVYGDRIELKATYLQQSYREADVRGLFHDFIENIQKFSEQPQVDAVLQNSSIAQTNEEQAELIEADEALVSAIAAVWSQVFNITVEPTTNFFDIGGDSISSLRIVSKLREAGIVVAMRQIFDTPTPRLLAQAATRAEQSTTTNSMSVTVSPDAQAEARRRYSDNIEAVVRVSNVQQGILDRPSRAQSLYHDQSTFTYEGAMDPALFNEAWNVVAAQNDALRMRYFQHENVWYSAVLRQQNIPFQFINVRSFSQQDARIQKAIDDDLQHSFTVETEPLVRLQLFQTDAEKYVLFLSFHILATDGWSFAFLLDDIFTAYESLLAGQAPDLPQRKPSYLAYLQSFQESDSTIGRQHWRHYLADLSVTSAPSSIKHYDHLKNVTRELDDTITAKIQERATAAGLSVNSLVQAAWAIVSAASDGAVIFGATASARHRNGVSYEDTIGLFFNDVPIAARIETDELVLAAQQLQKAFQINSEYSYISSYELSRIMGKKADDAPYESLVVFENYPKLQEDSLKNDIRGGVRNTAYWRRVMADIPKTLYAELMADTLTIKLSYNYDLVSDEEAKRLVESLADTLRSCTM